MLSSNSVARPVSFMLPVVPGKCDGGLFLMAAPWSIFFFGFWFDIVYVDSLFPCSSSTATMPSSQESSEISKQQKKVGAVTSKATVADNKRRGSTPEHPSLGAMILEA